MFFFLFLDLEFQTVLVVTESLYVKQHWADYSVGLNQNIKISQRKHVILLKTMAGWDSGKKKLSYIKPFFPVEKFHTSIKSQNKLIHAYHLKFLQFRHLNIRVPFNGMNRLQRFVNLKFHLVTDAITCLALKLSLR